MVSRMDLIITSWDYLAKNPTALAAVFGAGGAIIGGVASGLVNSFFNLRIKELEVNKSYFDKTVDKRVLAYENLQKGLDLLGEHKEIIVLVGFIQFLLANLRMAARIIPLFFHLITSSTSFLSILN